MINIRNGFLSLGAGGSVAGVAGMPDDGQHRRSRPPLNALDPIGKGIPQRNGEVSLKRYFSQPSRQHSRFDFDDRRGHGGKIRLTMAFKMSLRI